MTLSGDLLNLPLDITFTRLRAVRRKGVNEHGPVQMSGGEREIFFGLMKRQRNGREKFIAKGPAVPWTARRVVLVSAPANGLKRVIRVPGKGAGTRRNDEERGRETALPRRVPAVLRRHGESGATGTVAASAAVDLDVRHQTLAVRPETACGFGGAYRVFSRLAECGSTTGQRSWPGAEGVQYGCAFKAFKG